MYSYNTILLRNSLETARETYFVYNNANAMNAWNWDKHWLILDKLDNYVYIIIIFLLWEV